MFTEHSSSQRTFQVVCAGLYEEVNRQPSAEYTTEHTPAAPPLPSQAGPLPASNPSLKPMTPSLTPMTLSLTPINATLMPMIPLLTPMKLSITPIHGRVVLQRFSRNHLNFNNLSKIKRRGTRISSGAKLWLVDMAH